MTLIVLFFSEIMVMWKIVFVVLAVLFVSECSRLEKKVIDLVSVLFPLKTNYAGL